MSGGLERDCFFFKRLRLTLVMFVFARLAAQRGNQAAAERTQPADGGCTTFYFFPYSLRCRLVFSLDL